MVIRIFPLFVSLTKSIYLIDSKVDKVDQVVISLDSARFLPDNVTVIRIVGRIFNPRLRSWMKDSYDINTTINLDEPVYSPSLSVYKT